MRRNNTKYKQLILPLLHISKLEPKGKNAWLAEESQISPLNI